jgi:hypothetical protein
MALATSSASSWHTSERRANLLADDLGVIGNTALYQVIEVKEEKPGSVTSQVLLVKLRVCPRLVR